jgi:hypothetical protein
LLEAAGLAEVAEQRAFLANALFHVAGELGEGDDGGVELFG